MSSRDYFRNGRKFRDAAIRAIGTIGEAHGFATHDGIHVVVAAGDDGVHLPLCQSDLVFAECGVVQHIEENLEDVFEVALQAVKGKGSRVGAIVALDFGGASFEKVVQLIASLALGAAGAPNVAVHRDHAGFLGRFIARSTAHTNGSPDQRQLMVHLQKDNHAVRQLNAFRLLRFERRQYRNLDLAERRVLLRLLFRGFFASLWNRRGRRRLSCRSSLR